MSGVGRRSRNPFARRRKWVRDVRANMQIVEVMVVGLMVVGAVVAVSTMDVPVSRTEGFKETNESLVKDSLASMGRHPSDSDNRALFGSILEEYVMEAVAGNPAPLMGYLNKTLPAGANYNVLLDNGYGPPRSLIDSGTPPREAVAGSVQFVPKLAYTFMISDFAEYHGDFLMNVHALPISNGVLLHDEGDTVELAVTYHDVSDPLSPGDPVTQRTYGSTALRMNDPNARSWPSVAMYLDGGNQNHYLDASGVLPYDVPPIEVIPGTDIAKSDYNITFTWILEETAGIEVPKDTQIRFQFPRLWEPTDDQKEWMETGNAPGNQNSQYWKEFEYEGTWEGGMVLKARLKDDFSAGQVPFVMSIDYLALIDTANPLFGTVSVTLGDGVQGMSNLLVKQPGTNIVGALRREPYLSISKPLISGDTTNWGASFANKGQSGDNVDIDYIDIRQPQGKAIFNNVQEIESWVDGAWTQVGAGHWRFTPSSSATLYNGQAAWVSFNVDGGPTKDNNYRNANYLNVTPEFSPVNTTNSGNNLGDWKFRQRAYEMWEEWVHRIPIAPADGDEVTGAVPGWPDQAGFDYWVTGGTTYRKALLPGNFTYGVVPFAASSGYVGDYQGSHVFSEMTLVDKATTEKRDFALGERVRIRNDFSALFGQLSAVDALADVAVTDLRIDTYVYTPEKAWKGIPSASFSESAGITAVLEDVRFLDKAYIDEDDTHLLIAIDSGGLVYGLDATDGTKYWTHDTAGSTSSVAVVDLDGDGVDEVLVGHDDGKITSLDTRITPALSAGREQWSRNVKNTNVVVPPAVGTYKVTDMVQVATADPGRPELVVTAAPDLYDAWVRALDVTFDGSAWTTTVHSNFQSTDTLHNPDMRMQDLEPVWIDAPKSGPATHVAVASDNHTLMLVDATDVSAVTWVTNLMERPYRVEATDVDGDGADDIIVNTYEDVLVGDAGTSVLVVSGRTGNWGSSARLTGWSGGIGPVEAVASPDGGVFAVGKANFLLQDHTALYASSVSPPNLQNTLAPDNLLTHSWNGMDITPDGVVVIVASNGVARYVHDKRDVDGNYDWQRFNQSAPSGASNILDIQVPPDWASGGRVYAMSSTGAIYSVDDTYTYEMLASICAAHVLVPNLGIACGPTTQVAKWRVDEDAQGRAEAIFALVNDGETSPDTAGLYRYDVAAGTWTTIQTWTDRTVTALLVGDDGTYHVGGSITAGGAPWLSKRALDGTWTPQTLMSSPSGTVTSVLVATGGAAYAASDKGVVWRLSTADTWTRVPIADFPGGKTAMVETLDGQVWAIGQNYAAAPMYTHQPSSWAYFPKVFDELDPELTANKVEIKAVEGHLGGVDDEHKPVTQLEWWYRSAGVPEWTPVPIDDTKRGPFLDNVTYNVTLSCPTIDACEDVELRVRLQNHVVTDLTDSMRRDGGASPLIRNIEVTLYDGLVEKAMEKITASEDTLLPASTAIWTDAHQGFVTPLDSHRGWTYVGDTNAVSPATGNKRVVAVSQADLLTGASGGDVMITESEPTSIGLLLDGLTGGIKRPSAGTTTWVTDVDDLTDELIIMDFDGDGYEDVVGAGRYDDELGAVRTWDLRDDLVTTSEGDQGALVRDLVSLGVLNGQPRVAITTTKDLITAITGPKSSPAPTVYWTNDPAVSQGSRSFVYDIGESDMYGTAIVVSELVFQVTDTGNTMTQTARIIDWFNITPPNEGVPNPPIYGVEIVSWFNEA